MSAYCVDQLGALPNEQIPCAENHGRRLGRLRLDWYKSHRGSLSRLADCFGISGIVLLPFHEWFNVNRRYQSNGMPEVLHLAGPMMRPAARFHCHGATWKLGKEPQKLTPSHPPSEDNFSSSISSVSLEDVLGQIQTDRDDLSMHGNLPQSAICPHGKYAIEGRPPHHDITPNPYFKGETCPGNSGAASIRQDLLVDGRAAIDHDRGVWLREPVREMTVFAEQYDFAISLLLLDDARPFTAFDSEAEPDTYDRMVPVARRREW